MADVKTSELSQVTSIALTDLIPISQDQGGEVYLNGSRKITFGDFESSISTLSNAVSVSANHSAVITNRLIFCNAFSNPVIVSLPTAVGIKGKILDIKKIDNTANTVTIDGDGSETIDGALTQIISLQYASVTVASDGALWNII